MLSDKIVNQYRKLVRKRVIGSFYERLKKTDDDLKKLGLAECKEGRILYPWNYNILNNADKFLNSYLSHISKASSFNLVKSLKVRFQWLAAYFIFENNRVMLRYVIPRYTLTYLQQKNWFKRMLPGYMLIFQRGVRWDVVKPKKQNPPIAWIVETGRRICNIAERALIRIWILSEL